MNKINWSSTVIVMLYNGTISGILSKSVEVGILFGILNLIGGVIYGWIFGEKKI